MAFPEVGDKVKAHHRYAYRPDGCDKATATHIGWDDEQGRTVVGLVYDNAKIDWVPIEEFSPTANNGEPSFVRRN